MAKNYWFTSDTHFFHEKALTWRPFLSVDEMNARLVDEWNSVVRDEDTVYHLGDFTFGPSENYLEIRKIASVLNGRKVLTIGNHDNPELLRDIFNPILLWQPFTQHNFFCSHVPIHKSQFRGGEFQVHGHVHDEDVQDISYINVCVEQHNYRPVHLDEILAIIKQRTVPAGEDQLHVAGTDPHNMAG